MRETARDASGCLCLRMSPDKNEAEDDGLTGTGDSARLVVVGRSKPGAGDGKKNTREGLVDAPFSSF